jgi:hypothetical protein
VRQASAWIAARAARLIDHPCSITLPTIRRR